MKRILTVIFACALAICAFAQDIVGKYPDNYQGDGQYYVARALDPLMGSLGRYSVTELLKMEHKDAVDAIGDRGCFTLNSGVVVTPVGDGEGALILNVKPANFTYEYSAYDDIDCYYMIEFIVNRYSPSEEPIDTAELMEGNSIDLPVPTGTLRISVSGTVCVFTLLPGE